MNHNQRYLFVFLCRELRAVWDEENFSVLNFFAVLSNQEDYSKTRNFGSILKQNSKKKIISWLVTLTNSKSIINIKKYLKSKFKKEGKERGSITTQLELKWLNVKSRWYENNIFVL